MALGARIRDAVTGWAAIGQVDANYWMEQRGLAPRRSFAEGRFVGREAVRDHGETRRWWTLSWFGSHFKRASH